MMMRILLFGVVTIGLSSGAALAQTKFNQQCGTASWYELTSMTANGEMANPNGLTAAHKSLPFGSMVRVENLENGRALTLRINDRGPYIGKRIIDVSREAANRLGFKHKGVARVRVAMASPGAAKQPRACN